MSHPNYGTLAQAIKLEDGKSFEFSDWAKLSHEQRLQVMREIVERQGRDIRMAKATVHILREARVPPRHYQDQAAALLKWVQDNIYFVNEPAERLQEPLATLKIRTGDCDDCCILLAALFESIKLPWRFVLCGRKGDAKVRHIEGQVITPGVRWTHVYCIVGTPPFNPTTWFYCEPTVAGVPLGWDVVSGDKSYLPEMMRQKPGQSTRIAVPKPAKKNFRPRPAPPKHRRSPAYEEAYSGPEMGSGNYAALAGGLSAANSDEESEPGLVDWPRVASAVLTGVAVAVTTSLVLDWVNGRGMWEKPVVTRLSDTTRNLSENSVFAAPSPVGD